MPRPNRWSLFSRRVSVRPSGTKTITRCNANVGARKIKHAKTDTMHENNVHLLTEMTITYSAVAWWVSNFKGNVCEFQ